ncbi:MAG: DsbA family protein [Limnochordales bacterium]|nr:thioredoxin domain-containing protein [Limnochordales bacterium]
MRWPLTIALVLVGLLIGAQWWNYRQTASVIQAAALYYDQFEVDGARIGSPDAAVHVEEYFDFQCPHCHTASEVVVKRLLDEYVAAGTVSFTYRFFPILGPESVLAAQAAYCAIEMDAFWPYQAVLMSKKGLGNNGTYSRDNLIKYAGQLGLDTGAFRECLDGSESLQYVQQSYERALRMGLQGTPTFVVNGQVLRLSSWEDVFHAVDRALAAASR